MSIEQWPSSSQAGLSIIEIIVAVSLLVMIAAGAVVAVLGSFSSTRLAKEELRATLLAEEGIEAVQSIRNRDWNLVVTGTHGLDKSGGSWSLSGNSDTDSSGTYTRSVLITEVERNDDGDIVQSSGMVDPNTKLVTVSVQWDFTPGRQNTAELAQYLTHWQEGLGAGQADTGSGSATSCAEYCQTQAYSGGSCRQNSNQCSNNGETYELGGDQFCSVGGNNVCCCTP